MIIIKNDKLSFKGNKVDLLSEYTIITKKMLEHIDKRRVKFAFDIAMMSDEEVKQKVREAEVKLALLGIDPKILDEDI